MSVTTRYVVTAAPPTIVTPQDLAGLPLVADWVELRLDLLQQPLQAEHVEAWVRAAPRPVLATVRSTTQGGRFLGTSADAALILCEAALHGAVAVDAEEDVLPFLAELPDGVEIVAATHAPHPERGEAAEDTLWKLALPVDSADAWDRALRLHARTRTTRSFVVPYGALGHARSAFVERDRTSLLYGGALEPCPAIPGQPPLEVLLDELRTGEVDVSAALFGLCGTPPSRSPSPAMHNAVFRAAGRNALYVPLHGLSLQEAVRLPLHGLSVTTPWKRAAFELAASHDEAARETGVVNTLIRRNGGWSGANTDVAGIVDGIVAGIVDGAGTPVATDAQRAFVYGAGGFARAAVVAFGRLGYDVRVGARNAAAGRALAKTAGVAWAGERYQQERGDRVVFNATPAGADGAAVGAFADADLSELVVIDAPYRATGETGLVTQARARGCERVVDGRDLLVAQAVHQAKLFTPGLALDDVRGVIELAVRPPPSLVLIGARGAGKTSVGRAVATRLGRPFVDLDEEVERRTGRAPSDWIEAFGWDAFRNEEQRALACAVHRRGVVLATGGGVVEQEANRSMLRTAGFVVHLDVDPTTSAVRLHAAPGDRPRWPGARSLDEECSLLIERRAPWWTACADDTVDARPSIEDVVRDVTRAWLDEDRRTAR